MPLGFRTLEKTQRVCREELESAGFLATLWPQEATIEMSLQTFEANFTRSTALPLKLYQVQRRSREMPKPRGGLLYARETVTCEAFSYCAANDPGPGAGLPLLEKILHRCGASFVTTDSVVTTTRASAVACLTLTPSGRDWVFRSDKGNYCATEHYARGGSRPWTFSGDPLGEPEKVHTPGLVTVRDVADFLMMPNNQILKTLVFRTSASGPALASGVNPKWVVAVVRGDHSVNRRKLDAALWDSFHVWLMPSADEKDLPELDEQWVKGFVGPDAAMRKADAVMIVDYDAAANAAWVAGGNERDYHVRPFNWFRECGDRLADPNKTAVADIRDALDGDPSPLNDGGRLVAARCVEIAGALERPGQNSRETRAQALEIDLGRLLAAIVECSHDERGIVWPAAIAPYEVVITALGYKGETQIAADRTYEQLSAAGFDTLLDDRDAGPGVKFADADLIGFPVRVAVGARGLKEGVVEVRARENGQAVRVPVGGVIGAVRAALGQSGASIS